MATEPTQLLAQLPDGPVYADPLKPNYQVRFKTTSAQKSLDGVRVTNYVTEIIISDVNPIVVGALNPNDTLSVRLRVSGSSESMTRLKAIINNLGTQVATWGTENAFLGFDPLTVPTNPI